MADLMVDVSLNKLLKTTEIFLKMVANISNLTIVDSI